MGPGRRGIQRGEIYVPVRNASIIKIKWTLDSGQCRIEKKRDQVEKNALVKVVFEKSQNRSQHRITVGTNHRQEQAGTNHMQEPIAGTDHQQKQLKRTRVVEGRGEQFKEEKYLFPYETHRGQELEIIEVEH